jgi:hypothetical protein
MVFRWFGCPDIDRKRALRWLVAWIALLSMQAGAHAQSGGLFGMDRFDENEAHGIFTRPNQKLVDYTVILTMGGTALWKERARRLAGRCGNRSTRRWPAA